MIKNRGLFNEVQEFLSNVNDIHIEADGYIKLFDKIPSPYNIDIATKATMKTRRRGRYNIITEYSRPILGEPACRIVKRELIQDCIINGYIPDDDLYLLPIYIDRYIVPCVKPYKNKSGVISNEDVYYKFTDNGTEWSITVDMRSLSNEIIFVPIDLLKHNHNGRFIIKLRRSVKSVVRDKRVWWRESLRAPYEPLYVTINLNFGLIQSICKHMYTSFNFQMASIQNWIDEDCRRSGDRNITKYDTTAKYQYYDTSEPFEGSWDIIEQEYLLTSKRKPKTFDPSSINPSANQLVDLTMIPESV